MRACDAGSEAPELVRLVEAVIDPADQVAVGNVANEKVQAVGNLIQVAVSQTVSGQGARRDVVRLGAGPARFLVSAGVEMPIGLQLWAGCWSSKVLANRTPGRLPMAAHVIFRNLVRDPLEAEIMYQPVEQCGGVAPFNRAT